MVGSIDQKVYLEFNFKEGRLNKMITAGIDVGASSVKAVIMDGGKILGKFLQAITEKN